MLRRWSTLLLAGLLVLCTGSWTPDATSLASLTQDVRSHHELPALGVLVQTPGSATQLEVAGVRKLGEEATVTESDLWHIGSNTKAMTATLVGTFVRDGSLRFETRIDELYPEAAPGLLPNVAGITIEQLLTHRAGLPPNPFETPEAYFATMAGETDTREQRRLVLEHALSQPLLLEPGTDFAYSNTGYVVAAALIERLGDDSWESVLAERVLAPLGIENFGFGAPGTAAQVDQPWGHRPSSDAPIPVAPDDDEHQNPAVFNPAGGLHISLADWALFATEHLRGARGEGVLFSKEIYEHLHAPPGGESGFAMGWGVLIEKGQPAMLTHSGSDGNWYADIRVYPLTNIVFLMVTNDGREDSAAKDAFKEIRRALNDQYTPVPD